ncbi:angiopoietin-1 isoform X1 [Poecilia reticulata]|uniref:angiopoietin-1 isoform X1 n=1 Tax=Poecilia reticulata TaxID=8081 RepID=UPI0004A2B59A|nr:PREDICTED: angiopoietin-1 isoform X1 [Poecilia reticulata]XP_017162797.1 PREDICTED: angiopoietin-1 isoform X1 [Poecilia reticulata]XP_017162798.1 PREDICTED: angiopoietin-1 isoform X1 [Poecilia reticulata]XP_017162799.1 PREDICTED: angiopoietin-1 isoform X1 [Poecilia reticulata]XP_017162800.1 PREDICTED: angiopoietin-1 isoform X1 [Poecilia reticulata]
MMLGLHVGRRSLLLLSLLLLAVRRADQQRLHQVQHGQCTYTFVLPEEGRAGCREARGGGGGGGGGRTSPHDANAIQRDAPPAEPSLKIQQLESVMQNYTQWLQKIESYIRDSMKTDMAHLQQSAMHNHTAAMLEMGTSLLSQTAEQTRKLTDVETQVLNQTSRLEIQLLENSLSTNKLEKQLMIQTTEISKLHDKNSLLERKMLQMEQHHGEQLQALRQEKRSLQALVGRQSAAIRQLEARGNGSALQEMMGSRCSEQAGASNQSGAADEEKQFADCADLYKAGFHRNSVYTIQINPQETRKVFCNMESAGGGWTVIQRRQDGSEDFQRTWKEYKLGFGSLLAEHWLGNEHIYQLTSRRQHVLRIELTDWDGHQAFSLYDRFQIGNEKQNYRLFLKSHSGTAGKQSSLVIHGADFSTKDQDNDSCSCQCAVMLTGGWWFDACGPSNLNGMYFGRGQHVGKLSGIKWHHFRGPSYSLRGTAMMTRPLDF